MKINHASNRVTGVLSMGCALAAINVATTLHPVAAAETACKTVSACVFGANGSSGYGVEGTATANDGVVGMTTEEATSASKGKAGVSGYDSSTNKKAYNSGVYGTSAYGYGVQGKSSNGTAVYGDGGAYGVYGTGFTGVYGYSSNPKGQALYAEASSGADGLYVRQDISSSGADGDGVAVETGYGTGLSSSSGRGIPLYLDVTDEGDTLIDAQSVDVDGDAMVLDAYGDLSLAGSLTQNDAARFATKRADGRSVLTYAPREAESTLEDTGETALVRGSARVALDPSFAATTDPRHSYLVFVTPEGENDGLYVTDKTAAGFTIRESHGGRSSVGVEYRIVAKPLVEKNARLPLIASVFPNSANFAREKQQIHDRQAARLRAHAAKLR